MSDTSSTLPISAEVEAALLVRVQKYIANDINSKIHFEGSDAAFKVKPTDVYIISFERFLNSWTISATAEADANSFYKLVYDSRTGRTIARIYIQHGQPQEAII